ncbi:hypothetical protein RI054_44g153090 [Pseudoscourfieldia marina]
MPEAAGVATAVTFVNVVIPRTGGAQASIIDQMNPLADVPQHPDMVERDGSHSAPWVGGCGCHPCGWVGAPTKTPNRVGGWKNGCTREPNPWVDGHPWQLTTCCAVLCWCSAVLVLGGALCAVRCWLSARISVTFSSQRSALSAQLSALGSQRSALSAQLSALSSQRHLQLSALSSQRHLQLSALSSQRHLQLSALSSQRHLQLSALGSQRSALSSQRSALSV